MQGVDCETKGHGDAFGNNLAHTEMAVGYRSGVAAGTYDGMSMGRNRKQVEDGAGGASMQWPIYAGWWC